MVKSRKKLFNNLGTIAISLAILVGALGFMPSMVVLAQTSSTASATPAPKNNASTTTIQKYWDLFWSTLAGELNLTVGVLKSDFTTAADATIDQAVKDGVLSQATGDNLKTKVGGWISQGPSSTEGFPFFFGRGFGAGSNGTHGNFGFGDLLNPAEFAKAMNMTDQELMTDLKAGKSIDDICTEKSLDPATVKATILAAIKSQLDTAVSGGKITQAQADQIYTDASNRIDAVMSQKGTGMQNWKGMPNGKNKGSSGGASFNRNGSSGNKS